MVCGGDSLTSETDGVNRRPRSSLRLSAAIFYGDHAEQTDRIMAEARFLEPNPELPKMRLCGNYNLIGKYKSVSRY